MQAKGKKYAAALAAVQLYLEEEAAVLAQAEAVATPATASLAPREPGQWAQSGRMEMMAGRRMIQLRAFSNGR